MKKIILLGLLIICRNNLLSQSPDSSKFEFNGYISNLQTVILDSLDGHWLTGSIFHNRLNFNWYPNHKLTGNLEVRNQLMYGETINLLSLISKKGGYFDTDTDPFYLTYIHRENSFQWSTKIDRLWLQYDLGKLEVKVGRQRINWGQTFVWNPNDIFNTYSFFDFDYPERPGSDAIRLQYYTGLASSVEAAVKINNNEKITAAGLLRLNKWNYDVQFLGGILDSKDVALGAGFSGPVGNALLRGEASYFHPYKHLKDTSGILAASLGIDYTFSNSLTVNFEGLYVDLPKNNGIGNLLNYYSGDLNVKNLSFTKYNFFGQASYPVNPLLNTSLALMYYPDVNGYYIGPSLSYSITNNFDFMLTSQIFNLELAGEKTNFNLFFARFKLNF